MVIDRLRRWARGHTRENRYSPVGLAFHWIIAALVFFQLGWGWHAARLPAGYGKIAAYELHTQTGLLILVITLARMGWRMVVPGPQNDADKPGWQSTAAHVTHYVFYASLIGLPISGWAMWSATAQEQPLSLAGVLPWPALPFQELPGALRWRIEDWAGVAHLGFVITLLVLIPVHVGAALKHHLWDRDDSLVGMLPLLKHPGRREEPKRSPPATGSRRPSAAG